MRKTFKKVVACLLAVLMVTFSVPFTALADTAVPEDYKPNFTLRFNTASDDDALSSGLVSNTVTKNSSYNACTGAKGAPLDYEGGVDKETGDLKITRLYLENSKAKGVLTYNEIAAEDYAGELTGQTDYTVGMPFTITLALNNISEMTKFENYIDYSDNIAPAVAYGSGNKQTTAKYKWDTLANFKKDTSKYKSAKSSETAIYESASDYYNNCNTDSDDPAVNGLNRMWNGLVGDGSVTIQDFSKIETTGDTGIDNLTNPKTGETGYDMANDALMVTYVFMVTGEVSESNPITFSLCKDLKKTIPGGLTISRSMEDNGLYAQNSATYGKYVDGQVGAYHAFFMGYNAYTKESLGAAEHTHTAGEPTQENVVPATCTTDGSYDEVIKCTECGEEMSRTHKTTPALGHKWKATKVVAPTYESQGYTEYVCENDPSHTKKDDYTAKLDGVKLTVNGKYSSYGSVEGYDFDKATWAGKNSTVTLKASPIEGAVFAGWEIDGKVVSTAETLELTMYKDITVTPIFQEEQKSTITVVFLDMYNNVTASYTNMTAAEFQAEMAKAIPTPAEYPGYTFAGWSQTDDAIKALDTSATITSSYKTRGNSYTVNAQGANITVNGETKADTFADIAYDTAVTVSADNAKAWAIDGTTVAVGSSYTFYVGSDVTITPVTDAVTDKPMTAIVSAAPATAGSYRVSFLASSYIPAGYTVIDRGFVYGKGATQDELTLEKVGTTIAATGAKVKSISVPTNKDTVNDFGLVYGVKNKDAAATAVAYVTVKSMADDSVTTVYSTISEFNY